YLDHFKYIVPQGSVLFGVGNPYQYVSLSNCFLVESPKDSYSGIIYTDEQLVSIAKRRGGNGVNISNLRPEGAVTKNAARTSTGIVPFMERFSNTIREVGQGGRRGALMISLFDKHPQIMDFINAKQDLTKVTGANISVQISDELMNAIKKDKDFILKWPVDSNEPIIRKKINARELWDALITQARNNAEPGVLFWDTIIKESPADCYASLGFRTQGTNPCSEIPLSELDSCRLILINLYSYIIDPFTDKAKFDYEKFSHDVIIMQRLADDIIDLEIECIERIIQKIHKDPESINIKIRELNLWEKVLSVCRIGRRTGCGITALGDVFAAKGIAYGSEESIRITKKLYKILKLSCYRSSVDMSKEISSFPIYDMARELENPFIQRIAKEDPELYDDMVRFGRRNIALLTTAPAGSMSILTQTTSGIEPLFQISYKRRKKIVGNEKDVKVDFVDASGDKWREFEVMHSKILEWQIVTGEKDTKKSPWYKCCAEDLAWEDRLLLQSGAQQHVDHAISSCLSVGNSTIYTSIGLLDIGEICKENTVEKTFLPVSNLISSYNMRGHISSIVDTYNNGLSETMIISTESGRKLQCTPNHKWMVIKEDYSLEWKLSKDISKNDFLVGRKGLNIWRKGVLRLSTVLGPFDYKKLTNSKKVKKLQKMSVTLARLIGYLMSDGSIGVNGISLSQQGNNIGPDFSKIVKDLFGVDVSINSDKRSENLYSYVANSREISDFFKYLGLTDDHNKNEVPLIIRCSGRGCVKEFIKGITLDGYVSNSGICVSTATSLKYLEQVRELLLNFGIDAVLYKCSDEDYKKFPGGNFYKTKKSYCLMISNSREADIFYNTIGFSEERKQKEFLKFYRRSSRIKIKGEIPDFGLRNKFNTEILPKIKSNRLYEMFHSMTCLDKRNRLMNRETLLEMCDLGMQVPEYLLDKTYFFDRVRGICKGGITKTYDLSVPDGNSYIANGFISHNTLNLPENVTVDTVKNIYMRAWELGLKGVTVYRKNSRSGVLVESGSKCNLEKTADGKVTKRPKELLADIHHIKVRDNTYFVAVGMLEGSLYEVFSGKNKLDVKEINKGKIVKVKRGHYKLLNEQDEIILENIVDYSKDEEEALTRMVSTCLRHGVDLDFVVQQCEKINGDMQSFSKSLARALKKYIPDGTVVKGTNCKDCGGELRRNGGCYTCHSCGNSTCM
ncbi:MAG: LAGLIDADG family homing endonuclease, partial [Candidatus Pacearchaeota archaeon]